MKTGIILDRKDMFQFAAALDAVRLFRGSILIKRKRGTRREAIGIGVLMTQNKYKNKKVMIDGELFDSKKEAIRYQQLKSLEKIHAISDLQRQVKYTLIPSQKDENGKVIEQKCSYIADFVYRQNGQIVVEDVKGYRKGGAYAVFAIKRKLMLQKYGIKVKEV